MKTGTPENFKNFMKCKIKWNTCTRSHVNKTKITIELANILDKNCALRKLEMASRSIKISNFSWGE